MGRSKVTLKRIESEAKRYVTFSKRRPGIFKKASELAILCGVEVAAVVFSPAGKAYSFGHPSVKAVHDRFLGVEVDGEEGEAQDAADDNNIEMLSGEYDELHRELDEQKARKERLDEAMAKEAALGDRAQEVAAWIDADVSDLGEEDVAAFQAALMEVQAFVSKRANQLLLEAVEKYQYQMPPPPQLFGGSTFEFGSGSGSSSANAGMGEMLMPMPSTAPLELFGGSNFEFGSSSANAGMLMPVPPTAPPQLFGGSNFEFGSSSSNAGLDAMLTEMPQLIGGSTFEFGSSSTNAWMDAMLFGKLPPPPPETETGMAQPGFTAGMEMDMGQQGLGPNAGFFPY